MIDITCPSCEIIYHADETHIGRGFRCKVCGKILSVERQSSSLSNSGRVVFERIIAGCSQSQPEAVPAAPVPPSLGWGWLCVLAGLTLGAFLVVWMLVQSLWVRKIDPKSKATMFYTLAALTYAALFVIGNVEQNVNTTFQMVLQTGLWWAARFPKAHDAFSGLHMGAA